MLCSDWSDNQWTVRNVDACQQATKSMFFKSLHLTVKFALIVVRCNPVSRIKLTTGILFDGTRDVKEPY